MMRVLIVGYGSMGKRRRRLCKDLMQTAEFVCVDSSMERRREAENAGAKSVEKLEDGIGQKPDISFVCTSPGHHAEIILQLVQAGIHVFTELNLTSDRYDEIVHEAKKNIVVVFMSSTMLYKKQIEIIDRMVRAQKKNLIYQYHVGQYLPDWHPWESYKDFFIGKKETNGVREILAIQLPWIVNTFGEVERVETMRQRNTELEIDYPDTAALLLRHKSGHCGLFLADVVSRRPTTKLEIIGEDIHLEWNGHQDDLYIFNQKTKQMEQIAVDDEDEHVIGYADLIAEQPYRKEIRSFLEAVKGTGTPRYSLQKDAYVLSLIDQIEGVI